MKRLLVVLGVTLGLVAAWSLRRVQAQDQSDKVIYVSTSQANFTATPNSNGKVSMAPVWGDAIQARMEPLRSSNPDTTRACTATQTRSRL
jgi:hypothetical protein